MSDPRDYKFDGASPPARSAEPTKRPYISVQFACCNVYLRIYRSADGTRYSGHCPKCARPVNFIVGEGGTDERVFVVR